MTIPHPINWYDAALVQPVVQIGQIPPEAVKILNRAVKAKILVRWRGCWNTGANYGMGPLKTWWGIAP